MNYYIIVLSFVLSSVMFTSSYRYLFHSVHVLPKVINPTSMVGTLKLQPLVQCYNTVPSSFAKPRVVVLGTGWSSFAFINRLDHQLYDVQVIR